MQLQSSIMSSNNFENFYESSSDNKRIALTHWPVGNTEKTKKPKLVLVWIHGFAEHRNRYHHFAHFLAKNSIALVAVDLRGHGESAGPRGHIDKYEEYYFDVEVALKKAKELYPNSTIILGAHSHGALVIARFTQIFNSSVKYQAMVLTAPMFELSLEVPGWKKALGKVVSSVVGSLAVGNELKATDLTHDKEIIKAHGEDPLIFKIARARWFSEVLENQSLVFQNMDKIKMPVLCLHGTADKINSIDGSTKFYEKLKKLNIAGCEMKAYDGFFHEVLNEIGRERVYQDILDWLKEL